MTFGEHLEELRTCLWRALVGIAIGFVIGIFAAEYVVDWIQAPLRNAMLQYYVRQSEKRVADEIDHLAGLGYPQDIASVVREEQLLPERFLINPDEIARQLGVQSHPQSAGPADQAAGPSTGSPPAGAAAVDVAAGEEAKELKEVILWRRLEEDDRITPKSFNVQEPFSVYIKAALLVGLVLSSPWVFYQVWSFVAAGLYPHEKKYVHIFLPMSLGLFLLGAATVFFFVFQPVLNFLFMFNSMLNIDPDPRITYWLGFVLVLPLGFGIGFQLPLVMLFLERIGIFTVEAYLSKWRVAILVIFMVASLLTPPDPGSLLLMSAPLSLLYFGGVLMCKFMPRQKSPYDDPEVPSD